MSGFQMDHFYIKSALLREFHINTIVQNIYFSDHGGVRIVFWKNEVKFTISK